MKRFKFACLSILGAVLLGPFTAIAVQPQTHNPWPRPPSRLELPTPYGVLSISTGGYLYESRLRFNDTEVQPTIEGLLNIPYAFNLPRAQVALISISDGNEACPVSYRWVILDNTGYRVSPPFGSCSEQIKVQASGKLLQLHTPSRLNPNDIDIHVYDGKTLKRNTIKPG